MSLPKDFLDKMQKLLGDEYDLFINSYEQEKSLGLRVNTLKTSLDQFKQLSSFDLKSIPWVKEGYFYQQEDRPGAAHKSNTFSPGLASTNTPTDMALGS